LCGTIKRVALQREVYWYTLHKSTPQPLSASLTVDVAVVGGGMAGLTVAQEAQRRGFSVAVLEQDVCGGGASGKSSGFITPDSELELTDLIRRFGPARAHHLWELVTEGVEHIRTTIEHYQLTCDYQQQASFFVANSRRDFSIVTAEHESRRTLGYESQLIEKSQLPAVIGSSAYWGGVLYSGTFGMNSYLYCQQLKEKLRTSGVRIHEHTSITRYAPHTLTTATGHTVTSQHLVFCGDHFLPRLGLLTQQIYHAQTFLAITAPLSEQECRRLFPERALMVWDTDLIYHYFRLTGDRRLLIGAAQLLYTYWPRRLNPPRSVIKNIYSYLRHKFPWLRAELTYIWPGLIGVSQDFVPLAGERVGQPGVYYIAAAAGLPWAATLGRYIVQKICDGRNDFDAAFSAERRYPLPKSLGSLLPTPVRFALSHGIVKYFR
jgi:gamma-glutamylputrescine oxidase